MFEGKRGISRELDLEAGVLLDLVEGEKVILTEGKITVKEGSHR